MKKMVFREEIYLSLKNINGYIKSKGFLKNEETRGLIKGMNNGIKHKTKTLPLFKKTILNYDYFASDNLEVLPLIAGSGTNLRVSYIIKSRKIFGKV